MSKSLFEFPINIQRAILYLLKEDEDSHHQLRNLIKPEYFEFPSLGKLYKIISDYRDKYKQLPVTDFILNEVKANLGRNESVSEYEDELAFIEKVGLHAVANKEYLFDIVEKFARQAAMKLAVEKAAILVQQNQINEVEEIVKQALMVSRTVNSGQVYFRDLEKRATTPEENKKKIPFLIDRVNDHIDGGHSPKEMCMVVAPAGCHAKGTKILMYDGSYKNVEDIDIGDQLMGPDSSPRNVINLIRGNERLIKINPIKGQSFTVNENHILSLRSSYTECKIIKNQIINISFKEWEKLPKYRKHQLKLYRPNIINFSSNELLEIDPYILGLYLGDGNIDHSPTLTSADVEVSSALVNMVGREYPEYKVTTSKKERTSAITLRVAGKIGRTNLLTSKFKTLGIYGKLSGDKYIPLKYKISNIENRLQILAGLLDTDGHLHNSGFEYCSKSKQLMEDVLFIARSCGFSANLGKLKIVNGVVYYRCNINGDTDKIPTKIKRKQSSKRKQKKSVLATGFTYEEVGVGDFYGFNLDGDHLYLLEDFTVTHNCGKSLLLVNQAAYLLRHNKKILYISLEMSEDKIAKRFDSIITDIPVGQLKQSSKKIELVSRVNLFTKENPDAVLIIKEFPTGQANVNTIRVLLNQLKNYENFVPDVIFVDYLELLRPIRQIDQEYQAQQRIAEELRGLGVEMDCLIWTATQANREARRAIIIKDLHLADSYGKVRTADWVISLNQTDQERTQGKMRGYVLKSRDSKNNYIFPICVDYGTLTMYDDNDEELSNAS